MSGNDTTSAQRTMRALLPIGYAMVANSLLNRDDEVAPHFKLEFICALARSEASKTLESDGDKLPEGINAFLNMVKNGDQEAGINYLVLLLADGASKLVPYGEGFVVDVIADAIENYPQEKALAFLRDNHLIQSAEELLTPKAPSNLSVASQEPDGSIRTSLTPIAVAIKDFMNEVLGTGSDRFNAVTQAARNQAVNNVKAALDAAPA